MALISVGLSSITVLLPSVEQCPPTFKRNKLSYKNCLPLPFVDDATQGHLKWDSIGKYWGHIVSGLLGLSDKSLDFVSQALTPSSVAHAAIKRLTCCAVGREWLCERSGWAAGVKESTLAPQPRVCNPNIRFWPWCYPSAEKQHTLWLILQTSWVKCPCSWSGRHQKSTDQHSTAPSTLALTHKHRTSLPRLE